MGYPLEYLDPLGNAYYNKESGKEADAFAAAQMSAQEQELTDKIQALVKQAVADRAITRNRILGEMGFKATTGTDGKMTLVRLSDEERRALQTPAEQDRSEAAKAYAQRAMAAMQGKTQLPSFIKKDFDVQKANESAVLEGLMGKDFSKSAAGQQTVDALKRRERDARMGVQAQDKSLALAASTQLQNTNNAGTKERIAGYNNLTDYIAPNVNTSSGLLDYMQNLRNQELQKTLDRLAGKRALISNFYTLGGLLGGSALGNSMGKSSSVSTQLTAQYPTSSGNTGSGYGYITSGTSLPTSLSDYGTY